MSSHARAVVLAAAAATPDAVVLLLALTNNGNRSWFDWLLIGGGATVICWIASVIAVTLIGVPIAWVLRRIPQTTDVTYVLVGAATPLVLYGIYCVHKWNELDAGPFDMSLKNQMELEGPGPFVRRIVFTALSLAISGSLAAYVYRRTSPTNESCKLRGQEADSAPGSL